MKQRWINRSRNIICVLFLIFVGVTAFLNRELFSGPLNEFLSGEMDFREMTEDIHNIFTGNQVNNRYAYINLNGLFARLSGRTKYNGAQLMNNGMLIYDALNTPKTEALAKGMIGFRDDLARLSIPFLFVAAPYKIPLSEDVLPDYVSVPDRLTNQAMNELIGKARDAGIKVTDLRQELSATREMLKRYFYRTDQHWTSDGAFRAFQILMDTLHETLPDVTEHYTDESLWMRNELPAHWLGSFGKKVGTYYAGKDSLIYHLPRFETDMSFAVPKHNRLTTGSFEEALIQEQYIYEKDFFNYNAYCVYIGGDYPITIHRNRRAPNDKKILLIKDSFMLPLESFLSTEFSEIIVIDPRHYQDSEIREYVLWNRPDLVLMMYNPSSISAGEYADLGTNAGMGLEETLLWEEPEVSILPGLAGDNCYRLPVHLSGGKTYRISLNQAALTRGDTQGFTAELYNTSLYLNDSSMIFDIEFCNEHGYNWTVKVPEDESEHELLIYAGMKGETQDIGLELSDISLYEVKEIGLAEESEGEKP